MPRAGWCAVTGYTARAACCGTWFRGWAERDVFMECYYPLARKLRPAAVAAAVAQRPGMADADALARFGRAARFHHGFLRYFPGARHRQV